MIARSPARYWVVKPEPLKMSPGLFRLGQDFGNGPVDAQHFQRDHLAAEYRAAKESVLAAHPERLQLLADPDAQTLQRRALAWMQSTLEAEHGADLPEASGRSWSVPPEPETLEGASLALAFRNLSLTIQEDFTLLSQAEDGTDRLVLASVCFPSGWRPEALIGRSFRFIHDPIPEFEAVSEKSAQLIRAMVERGPYVRFVWTVTADPRLDHHPDHAPRDAWTPDSPGLVRIERQVTIPFPEARGSLFLIRTYLRPFAHLTTSERADLKAALSQMPASILEYKGLSAGLPEILRRL